ncbi:MAG: fibronectin type III domain-containing protein [Armatimonadetes bacterium]|nr:fibronectin type III domain-containing protein [Armatimonadota bacterium]
MFSFQKSKVGGQAKSMSARLRTQPRFEELEARETPAALTFISQAGVYGIAAANGSSTSSQVKSLLSFNSGNFVSKTSGSSQAYASLTNQSGSSSYKSVEATTSAYGRSANLATQASAWTTEGYGAFNYVWVRIDATSGEQQGQSVQVTLTPSFVSNIGDSNQGFASNSYEFYLNGGNYLTGKDTTRGQGENFQRTLTISGTVGSTFKIAFQLKSYVSVSSSIGNTASMQFSLGMSVSSASGGGGGQYSAPTAPNQPSWSSAGGTNIYLQWNDVANETSYVVQYWNSSTANWVNLTTLNANTTSVQINYGLGYYWRIGAANSIGTTFSDWVLAK